MERLSRRAPAALVPEDAVPFPEHLSSRNQTRRNARSVDEDVFEPAGARRDELVVEFVRDGERHGENAGQLA
ncbi:MAG: hypothetical protein QME87_10425 [Bacillota bacterium]|nr:hypothetical protein [Bacillota bacterium]